MRLKKQARWSCRLQEIFQVSKKQLSNIMWNLIEWFILVAKMTVTWDITKLSAMVFVFVCFLQILPFYGAGNSSPQSCIIGVSALFLSLVEIIVRIISKLSSFDVINWTVNRLRCCEKNINCTYFISKSRYLVFQQKYFHELKRKPDVQFLPKYRSDLI